MGIKTSAVAALVADANASLSMDGSSSQEGRTSIAPSGPAVQVLVPIPLGINKLYALRIEVFMTLNDGSTGVAKTEATFVRDNTDALLFGPPLEENSVAISPLALTAVSQGVTFELEAPMGPSEERQYAWRWVLSPGYPAMFPISAG